MKLLGYIVGLGLIMQSSIAAESSEQQQATIRDLLAQIDQQQEQPFATRSASNITANSTIKDDLSNKNKVNSQQPTNKVEQPLVAEIQPEHKAYAKMLNQVFPMTADQIAALKKEYAKSQKAAAAPVGTLPQPSTSMVQVDLAPSATPPIIRTAVGHVSSLVFVDASGQEWPISSYIVGDPSAFNVQWDQKSNILSVQSQTNYKFSNIQVILKGLNTPVMLTLVSGQNITDYRVDLRIPQYGPKARVVQQNLPAAADANLLSFLNGVPPPNSKKLVINNAAGKCEGWVWRNSLYLRVQNGLNVLSPAFKAVVSSMDGTKVYQMPLTPQVLATYKGSDKITINIEGI